MRVRVKHKVTSSRTTEVVVASVTFGFIMGAVFGPVAGIVVATAGFAGGYPAAKKQEKEEADSLIDNSVSESFLRDAMRDGKGKITVRTDLKNIHPTVPPLGRLLIGDKLSKETTYYFDE